MWQFDLPNNVANKRHDSKRLDVASTASKPLTRFWEVSQEPLVKLGRCPMTSHQNNHVLKIYIYIYIYGEHLHGQNVFLKVFCFFCTKTKLLSTHLLSDLLFIIKLAKT